MKDPHLLIVEDDAGVRSQMRWCFDAIRVSTAGDALEAEAVVRNDPPHVVTLDLGLPPDPGGSSEGFELLSKIGQILPHSKVIVITGREERENAIAAIAAGAYDFYQKPIDSNTLRFAVDRALKLAELEEDNRRLAEQGLGDMPLDGLLTQSPALLEVCRMVDRVAPTDVTVLIRGETGTGKEIIARALHNLSARSDGPLVAINCAAIPEALLENELFGHVRGAFTGATGKKPGKIEAANGGTLFLDEIGDMPLPLQAKLLRFLQERTVERLGSHELIDVDTRVVAATHRDMDEMIANGSFREDLFYRVSEIELTLPPLRERGDDVILLAKALIRKFAPERSLQLSGEAIAALGESTWPGNVREMENRIRRACIMCDGAEIAAQDLELASPDGAASRAPSSLNLKEVRAGAERDAILHAMARVSGNVSKASQLLGVSRPTLYNLFRKYSIDHSEAQVMRAGDLE